MKYRPEIDGLRAIAVIPVILYHAEFPAFSGGFVGVDVFFVISGYLITSLLWEQRQRGTLSLGQFYERRARRILPALAFVVLCCLPAAYLTLRPEGLVAFSKSLLGVGTLSANFVFFLDSGYFAAPNEMRPLLHTWSLAVEEQFYLLFPALMLVRWTRHRLLAFLLACGGLSFGLAEWTSGPHPAFAFYLLPTRLWELLVGALLALGGPSVQIQIRRGPTWIRPIGGILGLAMIGVAVSLFDGNTPFPGRYALLPTLGTALIIACAHGGDFVSKLLAWRPLVALGLISYSAYLWHQPLFAFVRISSATEPSTTIMLSLSAASLILAALTWRFVEQPARLQKSVSRRMVLGASLLTLGVLAGAGALGITKDGFPERGLEDKDATKRRLAMLLKKDTGKKLQRRNVGKCRSASDRLDAKWKADFLECTDQEGPALVVVGDSHAVNVFNGLAASDVGAPIFGIVRPTCRLQQSPKRQAGHGCFYAAFRPFAVKHRNRIRAIVYHQSGSHLLLDDQKRGDSARAFRAGAVATVAEQSIDRIIAELNAWTADNAVTWFGAFPEARVSLQSPAHLLENKLEMNPVSLGHFRALEDHMMKATRDARFAYLPFETVLPVAPDFLVLDNCITFMDSDHLSPCGEQQLGEAFTASEEAQKLFGQSAKP